MRRTGVTARRFVVFSPWPESIFAFAPVWGGLTTRFDVLAIDLPGFGRSEARDDLFAPQKMGEFIAKAIDAFGFTSVHAVGLDVGAPSVLFAALARPDLFRSLIVGAGASTYPLIVEGVLKSIIEAPALPPLNAVDVIGGFLKSIRGYAVPRFVSDDYLASYEGDRICGARPRLPERPGLTGAASCVHRRSRRNRRRAQRPVRPRSRRRAAA
jgi:pimeloyl-ACP methyl ester carboxylesterase